MKEGKGTELEEERLFASTHPASTPDIDDEEASLEVLGEFAAHWERSEETSSRFKVEDSEDLMSNEREFEGERDAHESMGL